MPFLVNPISDEGHSTGMQTPSQKAEKVPLFEPIAIVGMGCRWPGELSEPSELWDFLQAKKDAYSDFPSDRINVDAFYHEKRDRLGSFYARGGCFLKSPKDFDHTFFGITPQEAMSIDPAQRKLLETVYEAFESSGTPLEHLSGSQTGCFVGNFNYDHQLMQYRDAEYPEAYGITGGGLTILSNRINYVFNLKGPSMTLDTACSSSMYALHLACSAIHNGDCSGAIVAGSNLTLTPEVQISSSALGAISPTSRCHTFDAAADGYARADGIGALYIKRLQDAITDGNPIRAVIRGTAVNANGKTGGITRPSSDGQESAIRSAYAKAGLDFASTSYFECHGTGTAIGDPLEVAAIGRIFASNYSAEDPLLIGSIKTNLGHSEPVSGIAGLMKVTLALERDSIPPSVGITQLNPKMDLKNGALKVITENAPWPERTSRIASINSFGYGGANAHAILEAADSFLSNHDLAIKPGRVDSAHCLLRDVNQNQAHSLSSIHVQKNSKLLNASCSTYEQYLQNKFLLVFSAHNSRTLKENMKAIRRVSGQYEMMDLAYTLGTRRSKLLERSFVVANQESVEETLAAAEVTTHRAKGMQTPRLGFVLNGQGTQWPQMGVALIRSFPTFRHTIAALDDILQSLEFPPGWRLEDKIREVFDHDHINQAYLAQPLNTAIQIALIDLLGSWNIKAAVFIGHSSGEIAAAYGSGLVTSREAIIIAYLRGKAVAANKRHGSMLAVGIGEEYFKMVTQNDPVDVTVACYNSPDSITLSGDTHKILAVKEILDKTKIFTRLLHTDGNAYHSPHMRELGVQYEEEILTCCPSMMKSKARLSSIPFVSSVTGEFIQKQALTASYWRSNLESPVRFQQALTSLLKRFPVDILIEVGPHCALRGPIQHICKSMPDHESTEYIPTMIRNDESAHNLLSTAGFLWMKDVPLDLERVNAIESVGMHTKGIDSAETLFHCKFIANLPRYQWQYEKIMLLENRWTREWRLRKHPRHDILGSQIPGSVKSIAVWRNVLRLKDLNWLRDHCLGSTVVFPAAGHIAMALEAVTQRSADEHGVERDTECYELEDITFDKPLIVPEDDRGVEIFFTLSPTSLCASDDDVGRYDFVISSISNIAGVDYSTNHSFGCVNIVYGVTDSVHDSRSMELNDLPAIRKAMSFATTWNKTRKTSSSQWYRKFASLGLNYGPSFRGLSDVMDSGNNALADLTFKGPISGESRYVIHPTALDSAIQLCIIAPTNGHLPVLTHAYLPSTIRHLSIWPQTADKADDKAVATAKGVKYGARGLRSDLVINDTQDQLILRAKDILLLSSEQKNGALTRTREPFSRMIWIPDVDYLTSDLIATIHPLVIVDDMALSPRLELLALNQLVQFIIEYPEFFEADSEVLHLQRFLDWTKERIELAHSGLYANAKEVLDYSLVERATKIQSLSISLSAISSEARLSCHMYENLPAILRGEKTGIQVALEDDRLSAMYKDAHRISEGNRRLGAIMALAAQKNPQLEILEVGAGTGSATQEILTQLRGDTIHRMYSKYVFTDITPSFLRSAEERFRDFDAITYSTFDMEKEAATDGLEAGYDIVTASNAIHASSNILQTLRNLRKILKIGGKLILLELTKAPLASGLLLGTFSDFWKGQEDPNFPRHGGPFLSKSMWREVLPQAGFSGLDFLLDDYAGQASCTVIVATAVDNEQPAKCPSPRLSPEFSIVVRGKPPQFALDLSEHAGSMLVSTEFISLSGAGNPRSKQLIVVAEVDRPIFDDIDSLEWSRTQTLLKNADSALWVTNGGLLTGRDPRFAMISGMARGIKTEMAKLQLSVLDLDQDTAKNSAETYRLLIELARRCSLSSSKGYNMEYRQMRGITYISRVVPDEDLNTKPQFNAQTSALDVSTPFNDLTDKPLQINIGSPGTLQTLYFQEVDAPALSNEDLDFVEIEVKAIGLSYSNIAGLLGKSRGDTFGDECAGIVKAVGSRVQDLAVGDRIFCPVFGKCANRAVVRASWCQKMRMHDNYEDMATISIAFCIAIRALLDLAHLKEGETVLIHPATGGTGLASFQIAALCGSEVFATVSGDHDKEQLLSLNPSMREDHIFNLSDRSATQSIMKLTVQNYWSCIAPLGRFVNVQRIDELERQKVSMKVPRQNISYMAFDLESLGRAAPDELSRLMARVGALQTQGSITSTPHQDFHASNAEIAFESCLANPFSNNVVITFEKSAEKINFRKSTSQSKFDPNATYLLVGCLGDLGRLFSRWMVQSGARHLTYFSRSGCADEETRNFLTELQASGTDTVIVKGDVASLEDVQRAIFSCDKPIKGVVQGALVLQDRLYENLTHEMFNALIGPRVGGTINLHKALNGQPLDFFLMWSSWTAIFGTATQTNYLATCSFMDAFARHRQSLGLPATSLDLSQIFDIGAFKRVPGYANSLTRSGLYGSEAYDVLQYCDAAIASSKSITSSVSPYDPLASTQLLAGIDAAGLKDLSVTNPLEGMAWYHDLRFSQILQATRNLASENSETAGNFDSSDSNATTTQRILKKLTQLLYISTDDIDVTRPISKYGIDSMVAAELRNWLFANFAKDVSLAHMLDADTSIERLEQMVHTDH